MALVTVPGERTVDGSFCAEFAIVAVLLLLLLLLLLLQFAIRETVHFWEWIGRAVWRNVK